MGKKATKAADNMYCIARYEAAKQNEAFSSREKLLKYLTSTEHDLQTSN